MAYLGNTPTSQNFISGTDYFNGTGSQTVFTLTRSVNSVNDIEVVINNVVQQPSTAYTLSGTTITFTSAPSSGTNNIYVRYLSTNMQSFTVPANSVTRNQLDSNLQSVAIGKNRIINGAMVIDQRNAGASVTPIADQYTLDRWSSALTQASKFTIQRNAGSVTPPDGFVNYLGVTSSSSYSITSTDQFGIYQPIEGLNITDLGWGTANAKTVTLSFWARSSLTGTFGGSLRNSSVNRSYPFSYTISSANTWEQKSITIAGDTSGTWLTTNGVGIYVTLGLGVGATFSGTAGSWSGSNLVSATGATSVVGTNGATFYITGVSLEVGTSATGFEYVNYQTLLANCQRYYQKFQGVGVDDNWGSGLAFTATAGICPFIWSPPLRASATVSSSGSFEAVGSSVVTAATLSFSDSTPFSTQLVATTTSLTAGGGCVVRTGSGVSFISVSAEL